MMLGVPSSGAFVSSSGGRLAAAVVVAKQPEEAQERDRRAATEQVISEAALLAEKPEKEEAHENAGQAEPSAQVGWAAYKAAFEAELETRWLAGAETRRLEEAQEEEDQRPAREAHQRSVARGADVMAQLDKLVRAAMDTGGRSPQGTSRVGMCTGAGHGLSSSLVTGNALGASVNRAVPLLSRPAVGQEFHEGSPSHAGQVRGNGVDG